MKTWQALKTWWLTKAWPWLKDHWYVGLVLPVLFVLGFADRLARLLIRPEVRVVPDPLEPANERARVEEETRQAVAEAERQRLERERRSAAAAHEKATAAHEAEAEKGVEELRRDPQALLDRMREVNR